MHIRRTAIAALLLLLAAALATGTGCGDTSPAKSSPVERTASAVVDCDKPAGWPSTKEEISAGFGSEEFAIRECASNRVHARLTCTAPYADIAGLLAILHDLMANDPDLEVRLRAKYAAGLIPEDPTAAIDLDLFVDVPPGSGPHVSIDVNGDFAHRCDVRVSEMFEGAPAEAIFFASLAPQWNIGLCGEGTVAHFSHIPCTEGQALRGEVTCYGANLRFATATDDHVCGMGDPIPPPPPPPGGDPEPTATVTPPDPDPTPTATATMTPPEPDPSPTPTETMTPPDPVPTETGEPWPTPSSTSMPGPTPPWP